MLYLTNIDLNQNQLQNAIIQPLSTAPSNPKLGQIYCNSTTSKIMWYNGSAWKVIGIIVESSATNGHITVDGVDMTVYTLPIATDTTLGGIKVGTGLNITEDGTLNLNASAPTWDSITNKPDDLVEDANYVHTDNNYTTTEKNKLSGIESGAQKNVQSDWSSTSGDSFIKNKPTKLSEFTNDENFIDSTVSNLVNYYTKTDTYTKTEVTNLIGQISTITITVVDNLPITGASNVIYLVPKSPAQTDNSYDEYLWVASTSKFEKIGDTTIDLSNYLQKTGDGSSVTVAFTSATSRALPATGETLAVIVGKVIKYFSDLKTVAFSGSYSDLTNKPTLVNTNTATMSTTETTKTVTASGTTVLNVTIYDSVTKEVCLCDVSINGKTVTVTTSAAPTNALTIVVSSL